MKLITTESGAIYEHDAENDLIRRRISDRHLERRGDGEWLHGHPVMLPAPGSRMLLALEPLGPDPDVTFRRTTAVVSIEEIA